MEGEDNVLKKMNRDFKRVLKETAQGNMARYSTFSDFLYTLGIFFLGVLFSIYMGVSRGRPNKELADLVSRIQGQKGKLERAKQRHLVFESRLYRLKTLERILYTLILIVGLCCYKSRDLLNFLFVDNGFVLLPSLLLVIGSIRTGSAYYLE